jgi:vitellogenic carboxypeptidase-like protein
VAQAEVAWNMGLIDTRQRRELEAMQARVVGLVRNRQWRAARRGSDEVLAYITNASASATLEDIRRDKAYDAEDRVTAYLNKPGARACACACVRARGCLLSMATSSISWC